MKEEGRRELNQRLQQTVIILYCGIIIIIIIIIITSRYIEEQKPCGWCVDEIASREIAKMNRGGVEASIEIN